MLACLLQQSMEWLFAFRERGSSVGLDWIGLDFESVLHIEMGRCLADWLDSYPRAVGDRTDTCTQCSMVSPRYSRSRTCILIAPVCLGGGGGGGGGGEEGVE